jgi:hypothetical protein
MLGALIAACVLGIFCAVLCGFCVWQMVRMLDREQKARLRDRDRAWREFQYLITIAYTAKPELASALANVPLPDMGEQIEEQVYLDGFGHAKTG